MATASNDLIKKKGSLTPQKSASSKGPMAEFLRRAINASRKSQRQIADEVGYDKPNMISMMKTGVINVPLEKIPALALALDVDAGHMLRVALGQYWPHLDLIFRQVFGNTVSNNEMQIVQEIRAMTAYTDVQLSANKREAIARILAEGISDQESISDQEGS